ncbi:MAG: hypothetical protein JO043_03370 [Candidatus Eremiobacteraeota bacterium]|nr:hypothetical protein [Candidatus Eremiobacteraeota bacterium]
MQDIVRFLEVVRRRWAVALVVFTLALCGVGAALSLVPRTYAAAAHVLIVNESEGRDPSVSSVDLPSVATSTVVLRRVRDRLALPLTLMDLKRGLRARVTARSSIMEIAYRDRSPERAVFVPNVVADELSRYYDEISKERADRNVAKLNAAVNAARTQVRSLDAQLARQAGAAPFVDSEKSLETITGRLDDLQSQRQMAGALLAADSASADALQGRAAETSALARHEILSNDALYRGLADGTARDEAQLAFDRASFTDRYPGLRGLEAKVDAERVSVRAAARRALSSPDAFSTSRAASALDAAKARALVKGDEAKIGALDALIATQQQRLNRLPQAAATVSTLRLERDAAQADFLALSNRRAAAIANRAEALSLGSIVVVDRAVRAEAATIGLGRSMAALVAVLVAAGLALIGAFFVDGIDQRLRDATQIERLYGAPLYAVLEK